MSRLVDILKKSTVSMSKENEEHSIQIKTKMPGESNELYNIFVDAMREKDPLESCHKKYTIEGTGTNYFGLSIICFLCIFASIIFLLFY